MSENYAAIQAIADYDVEVLKVKGETYGDSWRKRGGQGAFMMLARKWDRIENICSNAGYDIFGCGVNNVGDIMDDIADLRRYLLLVEAHIDNIALRPEADPAEAGPGYVNQDR